jgi:hypothetical protein
MASTTRDERDRRDRRGGDAKASREGVGGDAKPKRRSRSADDVRGIERYGEEGVQHGLRNVFVHGDALLDELEGAVGGGAKGLRRLEGDARPRS